MANQPIPVAKATAMMQQYVSYMGSHGINMNSQTQSVSFDASELQQWMNNVMPYTDEFRIFLGVYPAGDPEAGRITVIVWPYKNGQPATNGAARGEIEPFNEGQLYP